MMVNDGEWCSLGYVGLAQNHGMGSRIVNQ